MIGEMGLSHWLIITSLGGSIIMLFFYVMRQLKMPKPILDFRVFKISDFTLPILLIVIMFILFWQILLYCQCICKQC